MASSHDINGRFRSCVVVVAVVVFLWLWLVVEIALSFPAVASWLLPSLCLAIVVGCRGWLLFPMVVSSFPALHGRFLRLRHGCCGGCVLRLWLVVVVGVASSFPTVVSSLLQLLHLAIVVGCHGCHHCHGCFCGCCTRCCLLSWLMILVVAVVSVFSVVVSLAPVCVQFCLANCFCCCKSCCFCHALRFRILATVC